jgi:hypothetical protein
MRIQIPPDRALRSAVPRGAPPWAWVMTADGRVLYRLTRINGRAERNEWRLIYQLGATERREIRTDTSKAVDLLARLARERGHHLGPDHH